MLNMVVITSRSFIEKGQYSGMDPKPDSSKLKGYLGQLAWLPTITNNYVNSQAELAFPKLMDQTDENDIMTPTSFLEKHNQIS